jgi:hypothetical protein
MLDEDQQTAFDLAKDGHNIEKIFVKSADCLKKGILAETKRAHQLKGRCMFIDLDHPKGQTG